MNQKKLKVKGILFDLDGTIVDSRQAYLESARAAFESAGQKPPETRDSLEIPRRLEQGLPINDIVRFDMQRFLDVYLKTYYNVTRTKMQLVPNVKGAIQVLSRKAKLALITMRFVPKTAVIEELEQFGLTKYFTFVVTALDTCRPKPSPEALIKAVKALDVNICDCVIVGDSVTDMKAGKAAGAMTVAVLSGLFSREELCRETPDLILRDVTELPLFLDYFN